MSLAEIYEEYRLDPAFEHLRTDGIILVPGEGSPKPDLFIVGEAPGAMENTHGRPFVGASGQILRSLIMLSAELKPESWFVTNVVKYRPSNNRTPEWEEAEASTPYLRREYLEVGAPAVLVAVGGTAREALAPDLKGSVTRIAGTPLERSGGKTLWPMIHPRWAIGNPERQKMLEQHWVDLGAWYRENFQ